MARSRWSRALTPLAAAVVAAGCVVSSFDKVDNVGGNGGIGGDGNCKTTCQSGPNGEPACCFDYPDGPLGSDDLCGYQLPKYDNVCLPLGAPGPEDPVCTDLPGPGGDSLDGCCMPNGLCGVIDKDHGLGCMPSAVFGVVDAEFCGTSPCGVYCDIARTQSCDLVDKDGLLRVWECAEECQTDACHPQMTTVMTNCIEGEPGQCQTPGDPVFSFNPSDPGSCVDDIRELAKCLEQDPRKDYEPDCAQYCRLAMDLCSGPAHAQYPDYATCLAICERIPRGSFSTPAELIADSVACRFNELPADPSLANPESCSLAGPGGLNSSDHCGDPDPCALYCSTMKDVCPVEYAALGGDGCLGACPSFWSPSLFKWEVDPASGSCRLKYALAALIDEPNRASHCENAALLSLTCQ